MKILKKSTLLIICIVLVVIFATGCDAFDTETANNEAIGGSVTEYPEDSVVLFDYTTLIPGDTETEKTSYVYDESNRLIQKVYYSQNEDNRYDVKRYSNYYYKTSDSVEAYETETMILNIDGSIESGYKSFREVYENGQIANIYSYDLSGELDTYQVYYYDTDKGGILQKEEFYNASNNRTRSVEYYYENGSSLPAESFKYSSSIIGSKSHTTYEYDDAGNCITEILQTYWNSGAQWVDHEKKMREFDATGNMISEVVYNASFGNYIYPREGQETQWLRNKVYEYKYDSNGHLIEDSQKTDGVHTRRKTYVYGSADESHKLIMPYSQDKSVSEKNEMTGENLDENKEKSVSDADEELPITPYHDVAVQYGQEDTGVWAVFRREDLIDHGSYYEIKDQTLCHIFYNDELGWDDTEVIYQGSVFFYKDAKYGGDNSCPALSSVDEGLTAAEQYDGYYHWMFWGKDMDKRGYYTYYLPYHAG